MPLINRFYRRKKKVTPQSAQAEALKRDPCVNYFEGYFSVTLHVKEKAPVLGDVVGSVGASADSEDAAHMAFSELGRKVDKKLTEIPRFYPNVTIIAKQVMPDHLHCLLYMTRVEKCHLGRVIGGFMMGCTHEYWDVLGIDWRQIPKEVVMQDKAHSCSYRGPSLFSRGYNDVVPIDQRELDIKINYIRSNPERRLIKRYCYAVLRVERAKHSSSWTMQRVERALATDRYFSRDPIALNKALDEVKERLAEGCSLSLVGKRELLTQYRLLPLICHRAESNLFEKQKLAVMQAAREGAVIVSAFISPREREILHELMRESLPVIEIVDNGFSEKYKPVGQAFYACARGKLMQITPWWYRYQRDNVAVSRAMCLVMNELVRCVCSGIDEGWWKKG